MSASRYEFDSVVRGFHEYQSIWAPVLGEGLPCKREIHNPHDSFAVAVTKDRMVIGHLPRRFSAIFWSFLRSGSITCIITGTRQYSRDLVQGGLEVPCTLIFNGDPSKIEKVKGLLKENKSKIANSQAESKDNFKEGRPSDRSVTGNEVKDGEIIGDQEFHGSSKRPRIECESEWVCLGRMTLQVKDKNIIIQGEKLTDKHMMASQKLLKEQFTSIEGLCTTLKVTTCTYTTWIPNYLQIFHTRGDHWITLTTIGCSKDHILVCDFLYDDIDNTTKNSVEAVFHGSHLCYSVSAVPKQEGPMDCGLYAIAYATYFAYGKDPQCLTTHYFKQELMRYHLVKCLEQGHLTEFPECVCTK